MIIDVVVEFFLCSVNVTRFWRSLCELVLEMVGFRVDEVPLIREFTNYFKPVSWGFLSPMFSRCNTHGEFLLVNTNLLHSCNEIQKRLNSGPIKLFKLSRFSFLYVEKRDWRNENFSISFFKSRFAHLVFRFSDLHFSERSSAVSVFASVSTDTTLEGTISTLKNEIGKTKNEII